MTQDPKIDDQGDGASLAAVENARSASDSDQRPHVAPTFTPGPWRMPGIYNLSDTFCTAITGADGHKVATLTLSEDRQLSNANAHLISAAPELYEALRAIVDYNDSSTACDLELLGRHYDQARAALAKADGQQ